MDRLNSTLAIDEDVVRVKGVSTTRSSVLKKLGISTLRNLLSHYPRRYMDLTNIVKIASAPIGEVCTIQGTICDIKIKKPRRNLSIIEMAIQDESGVLIITIFNQIWLTRKFKVGDIIAASGQVSFNYGFKKLTNPYIEITGDHAVEGKILPVHSATEKLSANILRGIIAEALRSVPGIQDPIPESVRLKRGLMSRGRALKNMHFPHSMTEAAEARKRLAYEELFALELHLMQQANERSKDGQPRAHIIDGKHLYDLTSSLPFELTGDQKKAIKNLLDVMHKPIAANHMVLGDVGTGKTIVAAHGIAASVDSKGQSALLAPTEVLAQQHFATLGKLLSNIGIRCALLTGSTDKSARSDILQKLQAGDIDLLIGTHALFEPDVIFNDLTLAIIDEQQRFGVNQRAKLLAKGSAPDALYLTATPIPRTLALAIFGNLTLSYIKEKPNASTTRTTKVLAKQERGRAYDAAKEALARGEQVYVICPLIGVSRDADEGKEDKALEDGFHPDVDIDDLGSFDDENPVAAKDEARFLQSKVFPEYKVGLLYGSMPAADKNDVMTSFKEGSVDVLVSTTVIEVGVDVKNATVMIIEDADRFGLSQLHQIRGRVGRGDKSAEVFLISSTKREEAMYRLRALESSDDGFELAEYDLALRREGDVLGNRQSGTSALKLVNIVRDAELIESAHEDALIIIDEDPDLQLPEHRAMNRELKMIFKEQRNTFSA